ncbi:MAG: hypothetical protein ABIT05_04990 [Chitinophagaceae bacterium]
MKKHIFYFLALAVVVMIGCQKELSFEGSNSPATGSLQAESSGDCLPKTVNGVYEASKALVPATNTISVQVNVARTGTYVVYTDTVNGYFFRATGTFTTLGLNTVTLRSSGTPFAAGVNNFVVNFDSTVCDIQVTVLPAGAGGPAVFTLAGTGTPASCTGAVPNGNYIKDIALNSTNWVDISVNVTAIGTFTITTTFQGMTFAKTGAFLTLGPQTVRLDGSGTPTTLGLNTVPLTAGSSTCSFPVTVVGPAVFTIDCPNVIVNGTYRAAVALNPTLNTITIPVTVTSAGPYSISATINGMTFTGTGTLAVGPATITLIGGGTPTVQQVSNLSVGTPACIIPITVLAAPVINWKFTEGTTTYQGSTTTADYDITSSPPLAEFFYEGDNAGGDYFTFDLLDLGGGITNGEVYKANASTMPPENLLFDFYFENAAATVSYEAGVFSTGTTLKFTITTHNTATKTITGTFSGTVLDINGATKTITNGTFTATYP